MITSSNANFDEDGFGSVVRDLERAYLMLAELGVQGGDSPASTVINYNSELGGGNATMTPAVMGGTLLNTNTGSTIINKYNVALNGNWLDASGVNPSKGNGGNARGAYAIDWQIYRSANNQVASGIYSVVLGDENLSTNIRGFTIGSANAITGFSNIASYDSTKKYIYGYANTLSNTFTFTPSLSLPAYGEYLINGSRNIISLSNIIFSNTNFCNIVGSSNQISLSEASRTYYSLISVYGNDNTISSGQASSGFTIYGNNNFLLPNNINGRSVFGNNWSSSYQFASDLLSNNGIFYGDPLSSFTTMACFAGAIQLSGNASSCKLDFLYQDNATSHATRRLSFSSTSSQSYIERINSSNASAGKLILKDTSVDLVNSSSGVTLTLDSAGTNINSNFFINNVQILTSQQTAIANVSYNATWSVFGADIVNKFNDLLAKLRTHGIIAT